MKNPKSLFFRWHWTIYCHTRNERVSSSLPRKSRRCPWKLFHHYWKIVSHIIRKGFPEIKSKDRKCDNTNVIFSCFIFKTEFLGFKVLYCTRSLLYFPILYLVYIPESLSQQQKHTLKLVNLHFANPASWTVLSTIKL